MYKILKLGNSETLVRSSDSANIPKDERNADYREYLQWCSEGNEAEIVDLTGDDNE